VKVGVEGIEGKKGSMGRRKDIGKSLRTKKEGEM